MMKPIEKLLFVIGLIALAFCIYVQMSHAQTASSYDAVKGEVTVQFDKTVIAETAFESKPLTFKGELDKKKPVVLQTYDVWKEGEKPKTLIRAIVQSNRPMMADSTIGIDKNGNPVIVQVPTAYRMEDIYDGVSVGAIDKITRFVSLTGQAWEFETAKTKLYVIPYSSGRHSPVGYYINTTGSDDAAGTSGAPWKTLAKHNRSTFAATDTVYIAGGQTHGAAINDTTLIVPSSGESGATITYTSYGTGQAIITSAAPVTIWGSGGWVRYADSTYYHLIAKDDSAYACWKGDSLMTRVGTQALLDAHLEYRTGAGTPDSLIIYVNAAADTSDIKRSKTQVASSSAKSYLTFVNIIFKFGTGGSSATSTTANVNILTGTGISFTKCRFDSARGQGINSTSLSTAISNCIFWDNGGAHIYAGADSLTAYNNTIVGGVRSFLLVTNTDACTIKNNIMYEPITNFVYVMTDTTNVFDNNDYYVTSYTNKWRRGATSYSTLATWSAANFGQDTNSITGWPRFQGQADSTAAITSYLLASTSRAINAGQDVGITTDYVGNTVPSGSAPDMGAYEMQAGVVTTQAASAIEDSTATGNGTITIGDFNATTKGFEWDIDSGAPYANSVVTTGDFGSGTYTGSLVMMPTGTTIYTRSKIIDPVATSYGSEVNFLLKPGKVTGVTASKGTYPDSVVVSWNASVGATDYKILRDYEDEVGDGNLLHVADTEADAGTITPGTADASDSTSSNFITLTSAGADTASGTVHTYRIIAYNTTGEADSSATDTGFRGIGALSYQWYRSAGDSDETYSILSGATTNPYNDASAPTDGSGRYYKVLLAAAGAESQYSAVDRGVRIVVATAAQLSYILGTKLFPLSPGALIFPNTSNLRVYPGYSGSDVGNLRKR